MRPRNGRFIAGQTEERESAEEEFNRVVMEAVDEGLLVLGAIVRDTIYHTVEKDYQIGYLDIIGRAEDFHKALERFFGPGARIIEKLIAKSLCSKLCIPLITSENWTLADYLYYAKRAPRRIT